MAGATAKASKNGPGSVRRSVNPVEIRARLTDEAKTLEQELTMLTDDRRSGWSSARCKVCSSPYRGRHASHVMITLSPLGLSPDRVMRSDVL